MVGMKKIPGHFLIIAGCVIVMVAGCIMPVTAAVCDGPPNSQSFILFSGGCDRSPQVLPCTQGFIIPALPSPGGDFPTQYYLDFGDGSPPYYGTVDGVTHIYTAPGQFTLKYMARHAMRPVATGHLCTEYPCSGKLYAGEPRL